jgi:hypothetical protein
MVPRKTPLNALLTVLALTLGVASPQLAVASDTATNLQIIAKLEKELDYWAKQYQNMREYIQLAQEMKALSQGREKSYTVLSNPTMQRMLGSATANSNDGSIYGEVQSAVDLDAKIEALSKKISTSTGNQRVQYEHSRDLMIAYRNLGFLRKANQQDFNQSNMNNSERDSSNKTAAATTGMFNLMLGAEQKQKEQEMNAVDGLALQRGLSTNMADSYKALDEHPAE